MVKKLQCKNCNYVWDYKGTNPFKATCPYCGWKVYIKNNEVSQ